MDALNTGEDLIHYLKHSFFLESDSSFPELESAKNNPPL
jgi:hypothetical protein